MDRVTRAAGAALLLGLAAGCGGKPLPPETSPDVARDALVAALDAWKEGKPPESLSGRTPPVDFLDLSWKAGGSLTRYEVKNQERAGMGVRITVAMTVRQKDGTSRDRVAAYVVDAGPPVVIRPEM